MKFDDNRYFLMKNDTTSRGMLSRPKIAMCGHPPKPLSVSVVFVFRMASFGRSQVLPGAGGIGPLGRASSSFEQCSR